MPGISYDGGYAQFMVALVDAFARIPQDLSDVDAAPLLCAGITTFNALRHSGARGGDLVAIYGIGGLGHLGVQYAAKMGFRTVAIAIRARPCVSPLRRFEAARGGQLATLCTYVWRTRLPPVLAASKGGRLITCGPIR